MRAVRVSALETRSPGPAEAWSGWSGPYCRPPAKDPATRTAAVATGGASQPFFALAVIPASVLTRRTCFFSLGVYTRLDWIGMFSPICIAPPVYHVPLYAYSCTVL